MGTGKHTRGNGGREEQKVGNRLAVGRGRVIERERKRRK